MRVLSIVGVLAVLALTAAVPADPAAVGVASRMTAIDVSDIVQPCSGGHGGSHRLVADGDVFRSPKGQLSEAEARAILAVVLASPRDFDLAALGITPAITKAHVDDIKRATLPRDGGIVFPSSLDDLVAWPNVSRIATQRLQSPPLSTGRFRFRVVFEGDDPVVVESASELPGRIPWTITANATTWQTWSLSVGVALQRILADDDADDTLTTADAYWREGFWSDWVVWREIAGPVADTAADIILAKLDGGAAARQTWRVEQDTTNFLEHGLRLELERWYASAAPKRSTLINRAVWWVPIVDGEPTADWHDLQAAVDRATTSIGAHRWLHAWKAASSGRKVELHVVGDNPAGDAPRELQRAWRAAGMKGEPVFDVQLHDGGRMGQVIFGVDDSRALVVSMSKGHGHWLDAESVTPRSRECVIVERDGRHTRCP